jgi:hypothetical protein
MQVAAVAAMKVIGSFFMILHHAHKVKNLLS